MTKQADPRTTRLPVPAGELPTFTPVPRQRMRRGGWSAERQRAFIEALALGAPPAAAHALARDWGEGGELASRDEVSGAGV